MSLQTDGQADRGTDGRTDVQRLTTVNMLTILIVLVVVIVVVVMVLLLLLLLLVVVVVEAVVMVLLVVVVAVVLVVVVVQLFMNNVLTQRSSGRFQTEQKLQRDCNNKSKQEKGQDKKKLQLIQLNVKVK